MQLFPFILIIWLTHLRLKIEGGMLNALMQKAFQFMQTVASSTQQKGKYSSLDRGISSSARYQNYQQRKQTNMTSYASWIWDGGHKWAKQLCQLHLPSIPPAQTNHAHFIQGAERSVVCKFQSRLHMTWPDPLRGKFFFSIRERAGLA